MGDKNSPYPRFCADDTVTQVCWATQVRVYLEMSSNNFSSAFVCVHLISKTEPIGNTLVNLFSCVLTSETGFFFVWIQKDISLGTEFRASQTRLFTVVWRYGKKKFMYDCKTISPYKNGKKFQSVLKCKVIAQDTNTFITKAHNEISLYLHVLYRIFYIQMY